VHPGELEVAVAELAHRLAGNAPLSIRAAKAAIRASVIGTPGLRATAEKHISACAGSADAREGQRAFLEKRSPRFTGA
jgi:enoyl-CoA hydratase/carnithine racemase